jgi:hypothetical protein
VPVSAIRGFVKRVWVDGQPYDELTCSHRVTSAWNCVRKKWDDPVKRLCRHCFQLIDPWDRIATEDTLFATELEEGFKP